MHRPRLAFAVVIVIALAPVVAAPGVAAAQPAPAEPHVTATELAPAGGSPPGAFAAPYDINEHGVIAGASQLGSTFGMQPESLRATLWRDGEAEALPTREGYLHSWARRVNDRGQVVLTAFTSPRVRYAEDLWADGAVTELPVDVGLFQAINERGEVLLGVQRQNAEGYTVSGALPAVWRDGEVVARSPAPPSGTPVVSLTRRSLSDEGHVAVSFSTGALPGPGTSQPFYDLGTYVWRGGTMTRLTSHGAAWAVNNSGQVVVQTWLGGFMTNGRRTRWLGSFSPADINDRGQVAGSVTAGGTTRAAIWQDGRVTELGGPDSTTAIAINERGQVLGTWNVADGEPHLVVWSSGHMIDLGPRAGLGYEGDGPDINDRGQVVGVVSDAEGAPTGMLWQIHDE